MGDLNVFNIEIIYSNGFRLIFQDTCALVGFRTKRQNHVSSVQRSCQNNENEFTPVKLASRKFKNLRFNEI